MSASSIQRDFFVKSGLTVLGNSVVSSSTGNLAALQVDGGAGIAKNLIVGSTASIYGPVQLDKSLDVSGLSTLQGLSAATSTVTSLLITGNTDATSTASGVLQINGGVGVNLNVWVGQGLNVGSDAIFAGDVAVNGGDLITSQETFNLVDSTATTINFARAGTAITIGATTGATTVRNATTISSNVSSTSPTTGALVVAGGVGVGGDLFVGGNITGKITTATHLAGGATGSIPYQTTDGRTDFISIGTAGFVLQSNGTTATWVGLGSITAGVATTASNIQNGAKYQIPYQTDTGKTAFEAGFEYNYETDTFSTTNALIFGATDSTSSTTGALRVTGGLGVEKNVWLGQRLNVGQDAIVAGDVAVNGGDLQTSQATFNLINTTATTVNFAGAGTAITIGADNNGTTNVRNTLDVTATANATSSQTGALQVAGGAGIEKDVYIGGKLVVQSSEASTGTVTSNALYVTGGLGVGSSLFVTGPAVFNNNVVFAGTSTYVYSTNTVYTDNIINVHVPKYSTGTDHTWTTDDGYDIGLVFNYYDVTADKDAFLGIKNSSKYLEFFSDGSETNGVYTGTTYGIFKTGGIILTNDTASTTTATGALTIVGGVGVGGAVNIGGELKATGVITAANETDSSSTTTGSLQVQGGLGVHKSVFVGGNITTVGDVEVQGGDITTNQGTFNLINATATTVNFAGAGTAITIGATTGTTTVKNITKVTAVDDSTSASTGALQVSGGAGVAKDAWIGQRLNVGSDAVVAGDVAVNGGDLITSQTTFNLINNTATTVNFAGAGTAIAIGATTGSTTIRNNAVVQATTPTSSTATGALQVAGGVGIAGGLFVGGTTTSTNVRVTGTTDADSASNGALVVTGGVGVGKDLFVGANIIAVGDVEVRGGDLTTNQDTFNLLNTNATTVNFANAGTAITIGQTTGTTEIRNVTRLTNATQSTSSVSGALQVAGGVGIAKDVYVGGTLHGTVNSSTNLAGGSAMAIVYQSSTANTAYLAAGTAGYLLQTNGTGAAPTWVSASGVTAGSATTASNADNIKTVQRNTNADHFLTFVTDDNAEAAYEALYTDAGVKYNPSTDLLTIGGNAIVVGDLEVRGGDLTTNQDTFNLLNTNATTVNFANAGTAITIGQTTGTTTVRNNAVVDINTNATSTSTGALQVRGGVGINLNAWIGQRLNVGGDAVVAGDVVVNGGDIETSQATFNLVNTTATTVNFAGAGTAITIGAVTGSTEIRNITKVTNTAQSTSSVTGALQVTGGAGVAKNLFVGGNLEVTGNTTATTIVVTNSTNATSTATGALVVYGGVGINRDLYVGNELFVTSNAKVTGDVEVNGGDLITNQPTFNLLGTNATTVNFAAVATSLNVGAVSGTTTIRNNAVVDINTNATSTSTGALQVRGGVGINLNAWIGQRLNVGGDVIVTGDVAVNGGDIETSQATFNLLNTTATTINFGGAGTAIIMGASSAGYVSVRNTTDAVATNDGALRVAGGASVVKNVYVGGTVTAGATQAATTGTTVNGFVYNNTLLSSYTSNPITSVSSQNLDSFAAATYRSAKYFCQAVMGTNVYVSEISIMHDGTKAYLSEYGIVTNLPNNATFGTYDATLSGGTVTLTWTANTTTSHVVKLSRLTLTA